MEFRDFCRIFVDRRNVFLGVFMVFLFASILVFRFQPDRFETSLMVNVSRSGTQATADYTYDQFYRLQADERFADTVVRWIAAPSVRQDIATSAGVLSGVTDSIVAKRLSSQMIAVTYFSSHMDGFGSMAQAIPDILNKETAKLNIFSKDADWFILMADDAVTRDARLSLRLVLSVGTALGMFFGFWTVLGSWYFRDASVHLITDRKRTRDIHT